MNDPQKKKRPILSPVGSREILDAVRAGYVRGVHGIPLAVDDVGLTPEQLRAKYPL